MPHFLHQIAYSREGWQAIVNNPQDRIEAVRPAIEKLGEPAASVCSEAVCVWPSALIARVAART
jgi:hypothetical protein